MIGLLRGIVAAIGEDAAVIDVGGVGYVVAAGTRALARLTVGGAAKLYIETQVREDSIRLFAFLSEEERGWFVQLQTVQSVGAKVALAILDTMGPREVADAIAIQDKTAFSRANGVGPKLAQRIVTELAGKSPPRGFLSQASLADVIATPSAPPAASGARADAVSALLNLGLDRETAARAVAVATKALGAEAKAPELIRAALKEVSEQRG
ncbi:MAG: Holliday junction branch migration protein RuvA [Caulobacterales bacterium]